MCEGPEVECLSLPAALERTAVGPRKAEELFWVVG